MKPSKSLESCFRRAVEVARTPRTVLLVFGVLTLIFIWSGLRFGGRVDWAAAAPPRLALLLAALALQLGYVAVKTQAWFLAWRTHSVSISWGETLKLFFMSAFIDMVLFVSAVASDTFKYARLGEKGEGNEKLRAIFLFRATAFIPIPFYALAWFASATPKPAQSLAGLALVCLGGAYLLRRQVRTLGNGSFGPVLLMLFLNCVSPLIDTLRAVALLRAWGDCAYLHTLSSLAVSQLAGWLSGIPMGFGAKDISLGYLLQGCVSPLQSVTFLLFFRLTGECMSAVVGWLISGREALAHLRSRRKSAR